MTAQTKKLGTLGVLLVLGVSLVMTSCSSSGKNPDDSTQRPNILIILADDAGYNDFGFQGSEEMETPNIDKLAKSGVVFTDAHVSATVCSPSRAGLMTGRYQQRFGHEGNSPPHDLGMDTTEVTLADVLKQKNYKTAVFGKWHLGYEPRYQPNSRGFAHFYGLLAGSRSYFPTDYGKNDPHAILTNREYTGFNEGYLTDALGDSTAAYIRRNGGGEQPFFIYLSFTAVHTPMEAKAEDMRRYEGHPRQKLAAMTWALDRAVGNVVQALDKKGIMDNTLIFFLSDNGGSYFNSSSNEPLKGWKGNKFEGGHRVPFFVHWKNHLDGGRTFEGLSSSMDIFPTSMAAAGIKNTPGKPLDGVNLLPYLQGEKKGAPHQKLFFRKEDESAMRDGPWKLIHLDDYGYVMYNLNEDLGETNNLTEEYRSRFDAMKTQLDQWEQQLSEPWWHEAKPWREVTWQIHKALMQNKKPKKVRP